MKKYCKAYYASQVKQFSGWSEGKHRREQDIDDNDVVYLWDDFSVVCSPITSSTDQVLFDHVTPEWQKFCTDTLQFTIPEYMGYTYTQADIPQEHIA